VTVAKGFLKTQATTTFYEYLEDRPSKTVVKRYTDKSIDIITKEFDPHGVENQFYNKKRRIPHPETRDLP